ncbi:Zinc finger RING-type [Trinorchestia longiramus]|nr:Zinc finger RING-type [Trinorchestia longiramus]
MAPVQCGSCRTVLLDSASHRLLDAHSGSLHSCNSDVTCSSLKDRSNLFLDTENMPSFVYNSVMETGYTTGRLKCPKCSSRIGAFNFVKGTQCGCGSHILPSVHLIFSKVDYQGYALNAAAGGSSSCSAGSRPAEDEAKEPLLLQWEEVYPSAPHNQDSLASGTKGNLPCLHSSCKVLPVADRDSIIDSEDPPSRCKLPTSASLNSFLSHFSGSETEQLLSSALASDVSEAATTCYGHTAPRERLSADGNSVPEVSFSVPGDAIPKTSSALNKGESAACNDCTTNSCRDLHVITGNDDDENSAANAMKCSSPVSCNSSIISDTETADAPSTSYDNSNSHNTSTFPIEGSLGTESQITNSPEVNPACTYNASASKVVNLNDSIHSSPSSASVTSTVPPSLFVTATSTSTSSSTYPCVTDATKAATTSTSDYPELIDYPDHLVCAICLELLFSPFSVKPCSHVFCEPCLRRLARPCPTNTACPLCREIIGACHPAAEYCREVRVNYPKQVAERHKFEQNNSAQHLPLPWLQNYRFLNFNSARHPRSGVYNRYSNWWRTALWIFWVDAIGFLLIITLNWFLSQNIGGGEQQLPSPPHLPVGPNPAVVLDGSGDGGGPYAANTPGGDESFEEYVRSMGAAENRIKGMASTDYQRYLKYHSPHTVSPIQFTAYTTPTNDRSSTHTEKASNIINTETLSQARKDELAAKNKTKKLPRNGSGERIAAHFFKSFDNFGDVDLDLDLDEASSSDTDDGNEIARSVLVTKLSGTLQPGTQLSSEVRSTASVETEGLRAPDGGVEVAASQDAPQEGVRWTIA